MVILDASLGGDLIGYQGDFVEKELMLEITLYMYERLQELGIPVDVTRRGDESISLEKRIEKALSYKDANDNVILISNRLNVDEAGLGTEIVYALRSDAELAFLLAEEIEKQGGEISKVYQLRLPDSTSEDFDPLIAASVGISSILIYYDLINNSQNKFNYAEGVVKGLADYLGYLYIPPAGSTDRYHIVKPGDTLYDLAKTYNTTVSAIQDANQLDNNNLTIGQYLIIPVSDSGEQEGTYTVVAGDTLLKIANEFDITVSELKSANNLTDDIIFIGQNLVIPTSSDGSDDLVYVVKSGDSLYQIAKEYNTTVDAIKEANSLTNNNLFIGQNLIIPTDNSNGNQTYTVKSGDSLYKIASTYNTTVNEIKQANNLTSDNLFIGQELIIPNSSSSDSYLSYTVKSGDDLYSLATRFNTTVFEIMELNSLTNNNLQIGDQLFIPGSFTIHTVSSGEDLYGIANFYNTTVGEIQKVNNKYSTLLNIGEELIIPN